MAIALRKADIKDIGGSFGGLMKPLYAEIDVSSLSTHTDNYSENLSGLIEEKFEALKFSHLQYDTVSLKHEMPYVSAEKMDYLSKVYLSALQPKWLPSATPPQYYFTPLQEWEGYVIEIKDEVFCARLHDLTQQEATEQEIGEFQLSILSADNKSLLREGAVFRYVIGYQRSRDGTKKHVSNVVFRRIPAWTSRDLAKAAEEADELLKIDWE